MEAVKQIDSKNAFNTIAATDAKHYNNADDYLVTCSTHPLNSTVSNNVKSSGVGSRLMKTSGQVN